MLTIATYVFSIGLVIAVGVFLNVDFRIAKPLYLIASLYLSASLGFGCGVVFALVTFYFPGLKIVITTALRIMFFMSGVFFSVIVFKNRFGTLFLLNPILQHIEMARFSLAYVYDSSYFNLPYLLTINIIALPLGLLILNRALKWSQT